MAESQRGSDLLRRENAVMLVPAMASASRHASDLTALWALVCPPGPVFTALISSCFSKDVQKPSAGSATDHAWPPIDAPPQRWSA